jgi:hypothetical protein
MSDHHYFLDRAEAELTLAGAAEHPAAARAHYHLAGHYLDRAHHQAEAGGMIVAEPAAALPVGAE